MDIDLEDLLPYGCGIALLEQLLGNPKLWKCDSSQVRFLQLFSCFLVLLHTTMLAQSASVPLRTAKLAQSTSRYTSSY